MQRPPHGRGHIGLRHQHGPADTGAAQQIDQGEHHNRIQDGGADDDPYYVIA